MVTEKELLDLCTYIVDLGKKEGVDAIEAHATYESSTEAEIELGQVSQVKRKTGPEIAIRLYQGKKMGSSFTNISTKQMVKDALKLAVESAKVTTADEDWIAFSMPDKYPSVSGLWDDEIPNSDPATMIETSANLASSAAAAEDGLIPIGGTSGADYYIKAYCNSNGVSISEKATIGYSVLYTVAQLETGVTPGIVSYDVQRGMNVDIEGILKDTIDMIRICKKKAKGRTGKYPVIFHPSAYGQLFTNTLVESIKGDNVARGKSKIGDRIGDLIADKRLSIFDDGLHSKGFKTSVADDEGTPRQSTPIVENGILRSFLWDTYWGNKMGVKSTGNAERNKRQGMVDITPSTLVIKTGSRDLSEIIKDIKYGYYVRDVQGAHSSNPESGDFSIVGNPAILIEDGKFVGAIDGLMISGNIFDMLKNIHEITRTIRYLINLIGPDIAFKNMDVIAKE